MDKTTEEKTERCSECQAIFKSPTTLRRHILKIHTQKHKETPPVKQKTRYNFECHCGKRFNKSANYQSHLRSHVGLGDGEKKPNNLENKCCKCETFFYTYSNLRKHAHKFHPDEVDMVAPLRRKKSGTYAFTCHCGKQFNYRRHYRFHLKVHGEILSNDIDKSAIVKHKLKECPICHHKNNKDEMIKHFRGAHEINIALKNLVFSNYEDFKTWKEELEQKEKVSFVKERGLVYKKSRNSCYSKSVYICHRSGYFKERGKGLRKLKHQGTNKINAYCPAEIKILIYNNGICKITYSETHVGHKNDLDHLKLTPTERKVLADKIASKVPFQSILQEIRNSGQGEKLGRFQLVNKKDLYNIEASFKLQSNAIRHSSNEGNIEAWIAENNNSILIHKARGVTCEQFPQLKTEDFILCIMNSDQMEILNRFNGYCICADYIKDSNINLGQNCNDFHILIVLDEWKQAIPCAFMLTSRSEQDVFQVFFQLIKNALGISIKTKLFISDTSEIFYNAWVGTMIEPEQRFFGSWFVKNCWKDGLKLILSQEKQDDIYKSLHNLLTEPDLSTFTVLIGEFFQKAAGDLDTQNFAEYFKNEFLKTNSLWAACARNQVDSLTNMKLERLHNALEYVFQQGSYIKRTDKLMGRILRFVKEQILDKGQSVIADPNNKSTSSMQIKMNKRIASISASHESSLSLDIDTIRDNKFSWQIISKLNCFERYNIWKNNIYCDCQFGCKSCKSCIHHYNCSCIDNSVKDNMCEHIHLLCRYLTSGTANNENDIPNAATELHDDRDWMDCNTEAGEAQEAWFQTLTDIIPKESIEIKKLQIIEQFRRIISGVGTMAEIDMLEKLVGSLETTLSAIQASAFH